MTRPAARRRSIPMLLLLVLLAISLVPHATGLTEYLDAAAVARTEVRSLGLKSSRRTAGLRASSIDRSIEPFTAFQSIHIPLQRALDDGITIEASPRHLARSGLWVTVEWSGVADPTATDFIAAYASLDAQPESSAPIKYQYAAAADANHMREGSGRVKFRLLEYVGGGYWFGFFRGNASLPIMAAKSAPVTVGGGGDAPPLPQGVHLALTDKGDEMRVTWKTPEAFFFLPDAESPGSDETAADAASAAVPVAVGVDGRGNNGKAEESGSADEGQATEVFVPDQVNKRRGRRMVPAAAAAAAAAAAVAGTQEVQYARAGDVDAAKGQLDTVAWSSTKAGTRSFAREDLCGKPASTVGFIDPGSVHSAVMRGLEPATAYTYRVGNAGAYIVDA